MNLKPDVNLLDDEGLTPLHKSVMNNDVQLTRTLLENGSVVNIPDDMGESPLHKAVRSDNVQMMELLLEHEAQVNQTNHKGQSALHICCDSYDPESQVFSKLVNYKANINLQDSLGQTPLHLSVTNGNEPLTRSLLDNGAVVSIPDKNGDISLHKAVENEKFFTQF